MLFRSALISLLLLLLVPACQQEPTEHGSWIPALEQTGFEYLNDAGDKIKTALTTAKEELAQGRTEEAQAGLAKAEDAVTVLLYYDIPMTETRQLIYDAGRLHALERYDELFQHLDKAEQTLQKIAQHGSPPLRDALENILLTIKDLRLLLTDELHAPSAQSRAELSHTVADKFNDLGHRINLMALKADLLLSGTNFTESAQ